MNLIVGIGECLVSRDPDATLVTHALGSCIAVLLYDPVSRVAGLLHFMLPESSLDPAKAALRPFVFCDTGIPKLLEDFVKLGASKTRLVAVAAGGAQMMESTNTFNIGKRNQLAMKKILWKVGIMLRGEEVGGISSRTVSIDVATGLIQLRMPGLPPRVLDTAHRASPARPASPQPTLLKVGA